MGDQNTVLDRPQARHLLRRSGFGADEKVVKRWLDHGYTRGQAADDLVAFKPNNFKPSGLNQFRQHNNWVKFMLKAKSGLNEKLTLFWHDHFATGFSKVLSTKLMGKQNQYLRQNGKGSMLDLVKGINRDPAMMEWLDTQRNYADDPNENYGRELMELFTLGVFDLNGTRNYSDQRDVFQVARAFTGHRYDGRSAKTYFNQGEHDFMADFDGDPVEEEDRGPKTIFGGDPDRPGGYGGYGAGGVSYVPVEGEGPTEIDRVTEGIFGHVDSDGKKTVARRTARRLFEFFAHGGFASAPAGSDERTAIDAVIMASGFESNWNIGGLVREILVHDEFYESISYTGHVADTTKKSIKWPTDFLVSTMRTLGAKVLGPGAAVPGGKYDGVFFHLDGMGQIVLDPPSVFGWNWEAAWISSQTLLARYLFAENVASAQGTGAMKPDRFVVQEPLPDTDLVSLSDPGDIVDGVTDFLGVKDDLTSGERSTLITYLGGPLNLNDDQQRRRKLYGLIGLVLQSPAYQAH